MQITRVKDNGCTIFATIQELEDLRNIAGLAIGAARKTHRDSPKFLRAIERLNRSLWKEPTGKPKKKKTN